MEYQVVPKKTKKYIENARLSLIYDALLCGISVMKPRKPKIWLAEKLRLIKTMDYDDIHWDSFIDEWMKPKHPFVIDTILNQIYRIEIDDSQPSPEMLAKAYLTYNTSIKRRCFNAMVSYHVIRQRRQLTKSDSMDFADNFYKQRWMHKLFQNWREFVAYRLRRQKVAFNILQHLKCKNTAKRIFVSWNKMTKEAQKTREYFEKLGKQELENEEELFSTSTGEAQDYLTSLPLKYSVKIFSFLNIVELARCSQVCRSWKIITENEQLWRCLNFEGLDTIITDQVTTKILQKARTNLSSLNLRNCQRFGEKTFQAISECRNLRDINMSECINLSDELLNTIARGCKMLTYLNISYTNITDNALRSISSYSEHLQYLSLAYCSRLSDEGFEALYKGKVVTRLIYIDLSGCNQLTVSSFKYLSDSCPKIKTWILNEIPSFSDEHLKIITANCKSIEHFELRSNNAVTDAGIKNLFNRSLKTLKLESSRKIADQLKDIGRYSIEVQHLYISDCIKITDQFLRSFSTLRRLRVLNLSDCVKITDQGVKLLVDSPSGPNLRELNLTNSIRITDAALSFIQKRCVNLTHLSVAYCENFSEAGMDILANLPKLEFLDVSGTKCNDNTLAEIGAKKRLRYLIVSKCYLITDLGLQKFSESCKNIYYLDLSFCPLITDAAIKKLAFYCRYLVYLNLNGCRQLSDLSIQLISAVCHYIQYLDLSGCIMITNKSLTYIKKGCRRIKTLKILFCKGISKKAVIKFNVFIPDIVYSCEDPPFYYGY